MDLGVKQRAGGHQDSPITETAVQFLKGWNPPFDLIVAVPPSRRRAGFQPVIEIARAIGAALAKPVNVTAATKRKNTPELKNVLDYQERLKLLDGAFAVDPEVVGGKSHSARR